MELIILLAIIACIPATIAHRKGYSFGLWWLYGLLLWIVALIHAICMKPNGEELERKALNDGMVKCPMCAELIKPEACKCKHCGSNVTPRPVIIEREKDAMDYLMPGDNGAELNEDAILELAADYIRKWPKLSVLAIMVTNAPEINRLKAAMPEPCAERFERVLERQLVTLKAN